MKIFRRFPHFFCILAHFLWKASRKSENVRFSCSLGRPTARNTARQGTIVNDTFAHNTRSELVEATVSGKNYEYAYDNIGNREFSLEDGKATMYDANTLNQYTSIAENRGTPFIPQFDADGNQTLIKTESGIWCAVYNAENRLHRPNSKKKIVQTYIP